MNKQSKLTIDEFGDKLWYISDEYTYRKTLHREDGPALETSYGDKSWWFNGERHRVDGPAVEWAEGDKEWWFNNKEYTYEEWFKKLTPEQQYNYLWNLDNI
jgi:hypothetical protein